MSTWTLFTPEDQETEATMRFILRTCRKLKTWTWAKIATGGRKGSNKPQEELLEEWLREYLRENVLAEAAPRYALRDALREILRDGAGKEPDAKLDWSVFSVEPREGWVKGEEKKEGEEEKKGKGKTVTPEIATQQLFEEGRLSFRWGRLRTGSKGKLRNLAKAAGLAQEEFLAHVVRVDFAQRSEGWRVRFVMKAREAK